MATRARYRMLLLLPIGIIHGPAQGAVRTCPQFVEHAGEGTTEKEAKKNALDGWTAKAAALGVEDARWQMAADRTLQCDASGGYHYCSARARPCVVKQVAPEGWQPQYPRDRRP